MADSAASGEPLAPEVIGWAEPPPTKAREGRLRNGPRLRLDWQSFAYAGKFVTPDTGVVVLREPGAGNTAEETVEGAPPGEQSSPPDRIEWADPTDIVAAAAVSPDRDDRFVLRIRYVTVRRDRRGQELGPRLLTVVAQRAGTRGYDWVSIATNNPYAHEAAAKAGFAYTGERTGLAELVCRRPAGGIPCPVSPSRYRAGLDAFASADRPPRERSYIAARRERGPPSTVEPVD